VKASLRANAPLLAVVTLAAVPMICFGLEQFIEYDGWIHIFISRAESLRTFHADWHKTTQPPLYFLLLKVFSFLGTSLLAYRALSIAGGLVSVFMVGKIAEQVATSRALGLLAAAGFGLSTTTVIMSCEVRSYTLAVAFILIAFHRYLRMVRFEAGVKDYLIFSASVIAGILTLYATAFFLVAAAITPLVIAAFRPDYRRELFSSIRATKWILAVSFAAPALVLVAAYRHHMWQWARPLNYIQEFYFNPAADTWSGFLLRGIRQEFNLFAPFAITSERLSLLIAILAAIVGLIVTLRALEISVSVPVIVFLILSVQIVVAGLRGTYPLGGHLRHQFLIFPFLVLSLISIAGILIRSVQPRVIVALIAAVIGANAIAGYLHFQIVRTPLFTSELQKFRTVVPSNTLLYLDEFSTIAFFSHYQTWHWHLAGSDAIHTLYYEVTKDGQSMRVIRARGQWNLKPFDEAFYVDLRRSMDLHGARSAALFGLSTIPAGMSADEVRTRVARAAATQHLTIDKIVVDGPNLYVLLTV